MIEARSTFRSPREVLFALCKRQDWKCAYCGQEMSFDGASSLTPAIEHIIPIVRAGRSEPDNLAAACRTCNSSKGDLTAIEYRAREKLRAAEALGDMKDRLIAKAEFFEARAKCLAEEAARYAAEACGLRQIAGPL